MRSGREITDGERNEVRQVKWADKSEGQCHMGVEVGGGGVSGVRGGGGGRQGGASETQSEEDATVEEEEEQGRLPWTIKGNA